MSADQKTAPHVQSSLHEYFEEAYNAIPQPILVLDENKQVLFINTEFEAQTSITLQKAKGKSVVAIAPQSQRHETEAIVDSFDITSKGRQSFVTIWHKPDEKELHLRWIISVVTLHSLKYFLCVAQVVSVEGDDHQLKDPVTGLSKKVVFERALKRIMARRQRDKEYRCAVLMFDLDDFKKVTHLHSREIVHEVLRRIGRIVQENVREGDVVSRFDSDKFAVILDGVKNIHDAMQIAQSLRYFIDQSQEYNGTRFTITASIGLYFPEAKDSLEVIRARCDEAMHKAKQLGKNRVVQYEKRFTQLTRSHLDLESFIIKGLEKPRENFFLHYMPIINLEHRKIEKFEALLRVKDPKKPNDLVLPPDLIGVAEKTKSIIALGRYILLMACQQIKRMSDLFPTQRISINVNVSLAQILHDDILQAIDFALAQSGADPTLLNIEITESLFFEQKEKILRFIIAISERGIRSSLDDFGAGQTTLSLLPTLPTDEVKIDKVLMPKYPEGKQLALIASTVRMINDLGKDAVVEGVETQNAMHALQTMKCSYAQGFAFSRGVDAFMAEAFIRTQMSDPNFSIINMQATSA